MAKRIPITIDAIPTQVGAADRLSDLVSPETKSVVTNSGRIIPSSEFDRYRAADVPEGFDTQTATINKGWGRQDLLQQEVALLNWWLSGFEPCAAGPRRAQVSSTGEFVAVANFPLPDGYEPDHIHLALYVNHYPSIAPMGIYLANKGGNSGLINTIRCKVNVFAGTAFHGAERPLLGFEWVCLIPADWKVNRSDIRKGQNLQKYLGYFHALLAQ